MASPCHGTRPHAGLRDSEKKKNLKQLKKDHHTFMRPKDFEIEDSDAKSHFVRVNWLNPLSGGAYIYARAVAKDAGISIGVNFRDQQQAQARAICKFDNMEKGAFNLWMQEPHI